MILPIVGGNGSPRSLLEDVENPADFLGGAVRIPQVGTLLLPEKGGKAGRV